MGTGEDGPRKEQGNAVREVGEKLERHEKKSPREQEQGDRWRRMTGSLNPWGPGKNHLEEERRAIQTRCKGLWEGG